MAAKITDDAPRVDFVCRNARRAQSPRVISTLSMHPLNECEDQSDGGTVWRCPVVALSRLSSLRQIAKKPPESGFSCLTSYTQQLKIRGQKGCCSGWVEGVKLRDSRESPS
jgi:hypothetical protein